MVEEDIYEESLEPEKMIWMLGFFDVLGFSARVKTEGIGKIYEDYQKLIQNVLHGHAVEVGGTIIPTFTGGSLVGIGGSVEIRYTYFSDTILLWMPLLPMYPTLFMQRCADLMCEALLMGIPLRGAISVGEGYMHKGTGIYLGGHIVDAARLEAVQDQIGVAMTVSATQSAIIPTADPRYFIEYYPHIKEKIDDIEEFWSPIALDWPRRWRDRNHEDLIGHLEKMRPDDGHVAKYYNNAIEFVKWSIDHNNWYKDQTKRSEFKHLRRVDRKILDAEDIFPKQWRGMKAAVRPVSSFQL